MPCSRALCGGKALADHVDTRCQLEWGLQLVKRGRQRVLPIQQAASGKPVASGRVPSCADEAELRKAESYFVNRQQSSMQIGRDGQQGG